MKQQAADFPPDSFAVTVCEDKAGVDESVQKAKDWVVKNAGAIGEGAPQVSKGVVIMHLK